MASQKITTLNPATAPLAGSELMEAVQGGLNVKVTVNAILQTPVHISTTPGAGTLTDVALPGTGNYVWDVDTSAGDVEIDGTIAQRDGQRVTYCNIGANNLKLGVGLGTAANRIRANAGPLAILQNDNETIQYCQAISRWIVV